MVVDPAVEVDFDDDEYPVRISVDADGEVWDWRRPPGGKARIPFSSIEDSPRWIQGRFARRGETREVTRSDAWVESFKSRIES